MITLEQQVAALMRLCTAEQEADQARARKEVLGYLDRRGLWNTEDAICQILLDLGAPEHLVGHPYAVYAITLVVEDRTVLNSITFGLYPQVAAHFGSTAGRVERALRNLIEVTWLRGDLEVLKSYFGNTVNRERGRPTNGEFIARIANIVRREQERRSQVLLS